MILDVRLIKEIEGLENRHIYSVEKEIQAFILSKNGKINRVIYYKLYGIEGIYEKLNNGYIILGLGDKLKDRSYEKES